MVETRRDGVDLKKSSAKPKDTYRISMGEAEVEIDREMAKVVEPHIERIMKRYKAKGKVHSIMNLADLRKIGFDSDEGYAFIGLVSHYGWYARETVMTRNPSITLTEKGRAIFSVNATPRQIVKK